MNGWVGVVEAAHVADRDLVLAHRIDPRPAVLAPLGLQPQRPPQRVDDLVERLRDLPDLLDAQLPDLGGGAVQLEMAPGDLGEVALGALCQHGHLGQQLGPGLERAELLALAAAALVAGQHADHPALVDEELLAVGLGQHVGAELLGLLGHPAPQLAHRDHPVAVVLHLRRGGDSHLGALGHEVDGLAGDLAVVRDVARRHAREELLDDVRAHDRAREQVRAGRLALLGHGERHLAELLGKGGVLAKQLAEPDRARQPRRARPHEQHSDLDALVLGRLRRDDVVGGAEGRRVVGREGRHFVRVPSWELGSRQSNHCAEDLGRVLRGPSVPTFAALSRRRPRRAARPRRRAPPRRSRRARWW